MTHKTRDRLLNIIDLFENRPMAVVGDLISDQFLYGEISRVSREAPVLVLKYRDLVRLPGGAANAANNLLELGCCVSVLGVVGRDGAGAALLSMLADRGADIRHVAQIDDYSTPVKTRILAGAHHSAPQQIVRVDRETRMEGSQEPHWRGHARFFRKLDGVIISDYGYGAADPSIVPQLKRTDMRPGIPVIVDSRFRMEAFHGVTSMTPNITELEAAAGIAIGDDAPLLRRVARRIMASQKVGSLLVTQGRFGMTLVQPDAKPIHIPIFGTDEVADVTGAGDTVIAVYAAALACGSSPEDGARLANYAGGIVVMKRGTATVSREELAAAVRMDLA